MPMRRSTASGRAARAAVNASARATRRLRRPSGHHAFSLSTAHDAGLSLWHSVHALGMPNLTVFEVAGTPIVWSRIVLLMLTTVFGMWHSTQEAPGPSARCLECAATLDATDRKSVV